MVDKKKVLVFGMTSNYGGVESFILNYYTHMDRNKVVFDFLCNTHEELAYSEQLVSMGSKIYHITPKGENYLLYKKELKAFFKNNAKFYDAIWVNVCNLVNIDYLKYAKKYGVEKRIIHSHNAANYEHNWRDVFHLFHKRIISFFATDYWACSRSAAEWFYSGKDLEASMVVYNAIDIEELNFDAEKRNTLREKYGLVGRFVIGNVGRLTYQKNQEFLLKLMRNMDDDYRLVIVGKGELEQQLKQSARELGVDDKVLFVGAQTDIQGWLSCFDVFAFSSHFEGLGIALLEAQANGIPSVISEKAKVDEALVNDNVVICASDNVDEWKSTIESIRSNSNRIEIERIKANFGKTRYSIAIEAAKIQDELCS